MKHRFLLFTILLLAGLYISDSYSQIPTYTCTIANDIQISDSIYEFDIYLLRTGATDFELAGWQGGFTYNDAIKNGGTLKASWVPGSPDPALVASGQVNNNFNTATAGVIMIASKVPPGSGNGAIISNVVPGTRMGRLRLINSNAFLTQQPTITWCFSVSIYPTNVNAYVPAGVGGINTSITDSTKFFNRLVNPTLPVETEIALPKNFELSQNYPNPFNPTTKIDYQIPVDAKVIMEIYNITGQKVFELVNEEQSAGYYTIDFGATKLSSGVYIYRFVAIDKATGNNYFSVKKMMLLK